jgi:hypothetical protein
MASPPNDPFSNASAERPVVTTENHARQGVTGHAAPKAIRDLFAQRSPSSRFPSRQLACGDAKDHATTP